MPAFDALRDPRSSQPVPKPRTLDGLRTFLDGNPKAGGQDRARAALGHLIDLAEGEDFLAALTTPTPAPANDKVADQPGLGTAAQLIHDTVIASGNPAAYPATLKALHAAPVLLYALLAHLLPPSRSPCGRGSVGCRPRRTRTRMCSDRSRTSSPSIRTGSTQSSSTGSVRSTPPSSERRCWPHGSPPVTSAGYRSAGSGGDSSSRWSPPFGRTRPGTAPRCTR